MARGFSDLNGAHVARAARFVGVGGLATLTYFAALLLFIHAAHLDPVLSSVLAYLIGVVVSFTGHRFFTYRSKGAVHGEAIRYIVTYALCFCIGNGVFWVVVSVLKWNALIAGVMLTACNVVLSYLSAELWIFKPRRME